MTHPLLTGDRDLPGEWRDAFISGTYISFKRPDDGDKDHYIVIEQGGEYGDGKESRPVEVWSVTMPAGRILMNWKDAGNTVGEGTGMSEGAGIALEYMEDDADE